MSLSAAGLPDLDLFAKSQRATFFYYCGLVALYDENFKKADQDLTTALDLCDRAVVRNVRLCLMYLIPVRMLRGWCPRREILRTYDLLEYQDLIVAMRTGQLGLFEATLYRHESVFVNRGVFLILEKVQLNVFRSLSRRVFLLFSQSSKIPLDAFRVVFNKQSKQGRDVAGAACILANLIEKGFIRGYLSQEKNYLVLSKDDPFPKPTTIL